MNGKILLDTNEILYILSGTKDIEVFKDYELYISVITEMELLSYPKITDNEIDIIYNFLDKVYIIDLENDIKLKTIDLRKQFNIKLPDSIILATSQVYNLELFTEDKKLLEIYKQII